MTKNFKYLYLILPIILLIDFSTVQAQKISPELDAILSQSPPDSIFTVLIKPTRMVDIEKTKKSLNARLASRAEIHKTIIEELKTQSKHSQSGLSELLEEKLKAGQLAGYRQFWIANLVSVTASVEAIREIALHPDVEEILENKILVLQGSESAVDSSGRTKSEPFTGSSNIPAFKIKQLTTQRVITEDSLISRMASAIEKPAFNAVNPSDSVRKSFIPKPILLSSVSANVDSALSKARKRLIGDKQTGIGLPIPVSGYITAGDSMVKSRIASYNVGQTDGKPGALSVIKDRIIDANRQLVQAAVIRPISETSRKMEKDTTVLLVGKLTKLSNWNNDSIMVNKNGGMLLTGLPSSFPFLSSASANTSQLEALTGKTEPKAMFERDSTLQELSAKRKNGESTQLAASPAIYLESLSYTLGNVAVGSSFTGFFNVYNLGGANLVISSITSSNPVFTVSPTSGTIAPSSYGSVYVMFSPTSAGSQSTTITISSNDPTYPTVLVTVSGNGIVLSPEIAVSTTSGSHGNVAVGASDTKTFTISNTGTADLVISSISSNNAAFTVSPTSYTISPGYYITVSVIFTPPSAGNHSAIITISSNDADESTVSVSLSGTGTVATPEIDYPSTAGDIGNINVGSSGGLTFNISNNGTADLAVSSITSSNPAFTLSHSSATIPPGYYLQVTVYFTPTAAGSQSTTITIRSNDADEGEVNLSIVGNGVVSTSPEIELSTTSGSHGNVAVGSSDTKTFTISNLGNADLIVSSIASDNPAFVVTPTTATIPPNHYLTVSVVFSPTTGGSQSARITVSSNDADESTLNVNITGNGVTVSPEIDVSSTSGSHGNVAVGSSDTKTFTISNTGTADLVVSSISSSNPAFAVSPISYTISPGYNITVSVTFTPPSGGNHSATITINSNDADESTLSVNITGNGIAASPEIGVSTISGALGDVTVGSSVSKYFTISNTGNADLIVNSITSSNPAFTVSPVSTIIPPGYNQEVMITFTPTSGGQQSAIITVSSNDSDEGILTITVTGNGVAAVPEISLSTTSGSMGDVYVGSSITKTFTIYNIGTGDLQVSEISSDNSDFKIFPSSTNLPPNWNQTVLVIFSPTKAGSQSAKITIRSNDSDEPVSTVTVVGNGIAASPEIELSTTLLDLQDVCVGESREGSFAISNTGTSDLVISGITTDNQTFFTGAASFSLPPLWYAVITVEFEPSIVGTHNATITIKSNDEDESVSQVKLYGTGVECKTPDIPVNPAFKFGWGLERVAARQLWQKGFNGTGVLVGIIDTGVDGEHPALKSKWRGSNGANISQCWFDPWRDSSYPVDYGRHGTHVTGLIVGQYGADTTGVAPNAQWIAANGFRTFNDTLKAPFDQLQECFQWMADPDGNSATIEDSPDIINLSVGGPGYNRELYNVLDILESIGIIVVIAGGNYHPWESNRVFTPANRPESFAVGATDIDNRRASFSCIGPSYDGYTIKPDVVAPGVEILSTLAGGGYIYMQGTSMASPLVAGVSALLKQAKPNATPAQIYSALKNTATDLGTQGPDNEYGWGLVNAEAAYTLLAENIELSLSTTSLSIGDVYLGSTGSGSFSITNNGSRDAPVTLSIDNGSFALEPATVTVSAGNSATVNVTFKPTANGSQSGVITFSSSVSDLSLLKVNVYGNGKRTQPITIAVSSSSLTFGDVNLGESGSGSFTLTNSGTSSFVIKSVTSSNPAFSVDPTSGSIPAGQSLSISVRLNSSKLGLDSTIVVVESVDSTVAPIAVTVRATVIGPSWSIASLDPDTLFVGWADQSLTVHGANLPDSGYFISIKPSEGVAFNILGKNQSSYRLSISTEKAANIGKHQLIIMDRYGRSDSASFYMIAQAAPELSQIFPDTILQGTLDTVTVFGKHLTTNSNVKFSDGGVRVLNVLQDWSSDSALALVVSSEDYARIGIYSIKVTNPIGDADSLIGVLFVAAGPPVIDSLSIPAFLPGDSLKVIIRGRRLQQGATISFSDSTNIKAIDYEWKDSSEVSFFAVVSKQASRGRTDIFAVSKEGLKTLTYKGMAIRNPLIKSVVPPSIPQDTNALSITVTGDDFEGLLLSEIEGNALTIDSIVIRNTSVTTYFMRCDNNYIGKPRFTFTNRYGQRYEAGGAFEVLAVPKITAVSPDSTSSGQSTVLTIEGANLDSGSVAVVSPPDEVGMTDSKFEGNRLLLSLSISDSAATGWRGIILTHHNGVSRTFKDCFFIKGMAVIENLNPYMLFTGNSGVRIKISGRGFTKGDSLGFSGKGVVISEIILFSSASIELVVNIENDAELGKRDLKYIDLWGKQTVMPDAIEVAAGVKGDASGDGVTNVFDLLAVLKELSQGGTSSMSDINRDGKVDVFDLLELLKLLSK